MFGLMQPEKSCSVKKTAPYRFHRMHYCGTCKTIGNQYGHSSRLVLNYDIVFLSEIISELNSENLANWQINYQAINKCTKMPNEVDSIPFSLEYAADVNVVLAALKLDDHIKDKKKFKWKMIRFLYQQKFKKAFLKLKNVGIDTDKIWAWIELQTKRESKPSPFFQHLEEHLNYFAEPTAQITSLIFKNGGNNLSKETQVLLESLGYKFGQINYILDAFEDLEQDIFEKQFNPLIKWFNPEQTLEESQFENIRQLLLNLQKNISQELVNLPINNPDLFVSRLNSNLALRLYKDRIIPKTVSQKIKSQFNYSKEFASSVLCKKDNWFAPLEYFLISFFIFLVPSLSLKMTNQNQTIKWNWNTFFISIMPFSNNNELLDNPIEEKVHQKKRNSWLWDCCCLDCSSGCGNSTCCASESSSGCECLSVLDGCASCGEGCSACGECCGGCGDCCGGCAC